MTLSQIEKLLIQLQTQLAQQETAINEIKNNYTTNDNVTAINNQVKELISDNNQIHLDVATLSNQISKIDHLNKLNDIIITNLSQGDVLQYDASKGKWCNVKTVITASTGSNEASVTSLRDLSDVQITSLVNGHCLVYNSSVGKWINDTVSTGSGSGSGIDLSNYLTKTAADATYLKRTGGTISGTLTVDGLTTINNNLLVKGGITMYDE